MLSSDIQILLRAWVSIAVAAACQSSRLLLGPWVLGASRIPDLKVFQSYALQLFAR